MVDDIGNTWIQFPSVCQEPFFYGGRSRFEGEGFGRIVKPKIERSTNELGEVKFKFLQLIM